MTITQPAMTATPDGGPLPITAAGGQDADSGKAGGCAGDALCVDIAMACARLARNDGGRRNSHWTGDPCDFLTSGDAEKVLVGVAAYAQVASEPLGSCLAVFGAMVRDRAAWLRAEGFNRLGTARWSELVQFMAKAGIDVQVAGNDGQYRRPWLADAGQRGAALGVVIGLIPGEDGQAVADAYGVADRVFDGELQQPNGKRLGVLAGAMRNSGVAAAALFGFIHNCSDDLWALPWQAHTPETVAWIAHATDLRMPPICRAIVENGVGWMPDGLGATEFEAGLVKAALAWDGEALARFERLLDEMSGAVRAFNARCPEHWETPGVMQGVNEHVQQAVLDAVQMNRDRRRLEGGTAGRRRRRG